MSRDVLMTKHKKKSHSVQKTPGIGQFINLLYAQSVEVGMEGRVDVWLREKLHAQV